MNGTVLAYLAFWPVLAIVGVTNGILRGVTYERWLGERTAHQLSTASGILLTSVAVWTFSHVCPLRDSGSAALIGGLWLLMTVAFEFLFGRYVAKQDWKRLLADYDLRRGRVWPLFLAWITILPWLVYRFWRSRIIAATERTLAGPPVVMCGHGNYSRNCLPARHNAL